MKTNRTVVGVDTAKRVFQLHWVDMETGEIVDLKLTRAKFLEHFANRVPCVVAMEACGGSQHWARELRELGHEPWLLPAKAVRPFVSGNKNDAHDARAIWTAAQMPGIKTVAVKSEEQQAILALHRMRQQLVKFRTAQINGLRGLLTEYGEVMPQVGPRSAKPAWFSGRNVHGRNEARIGRFHQGQRAPGPALTGRIQNCNLPARHTEIDPCVPGGVHTRTVKRLLAMSAAVCALGPVADAMGGQDSAGVHLEAGYQHFFVDGASLGTDELAARVPDHSYGVLAAAGTMCCHSSRWRPR